jgi:hypothetical protein
MVAQALVKDNPPLARHDLRLLGNDRQEAAVQRLSDLR